MNYIPSNCISGILSEAMASYGVGCKRFEEILQDHGIEDISYKRISDYCNGLYTPSYEKARVMLETLEYPISDDELTEAIQLNRELIKAESEYVAADSKEIRRTIRIKLKRLLPEMTPEETERYLSQRVADLCGSEK